jgi:ABC-type branched-subunit amino acid transport system ATPase component/ABC-type branched-subunit amino acid transport system permease subunit
MRSILQRAGQPTVENGIVLAVGVAAACVGLRVFGLGSVYWSSVLVLAGIYVLLAIGLNVVVGYAGLLDLGYAGFWAVGAYATAIVTGKAPYHPFALSVWWAIPFAVGATILSGLVLGTATLRVRGDYLAIVTLGFGEIVRILANSLDKVTGGPAGVTDIPHPRIGPFDFGLDPRPYVALLCVVIGLSVLIISRLWHSRIGRAWMATKIDEVAAETVGIPAFRMKLLAFATGATTASFAGVLYASYVGYITPDNFVILVAVLILAAVVMGGMGHMNGVVLGALAVVILPEISRRFEQERLLVFGGVLVVMMIVRPQGLLPLRMRRYDLTHVATTAGQAVALPNGWRRPVVIAERKDPGGLAGEQTRRTPILECRGVTRRFGGLTAVDTVSFAVDDGAIFAVIGPNGAGKSTLFDLISGVRPADSGDIRLDGRSLIGMTPHAITASGVARTFQLIRLFGTSSVAENVITGLDVHGQSTVADVVLKTPRHRRAESAALQAAWEIMRFCDISRLANENAANLSYGDQRRVEIARALATRPRILLLDEPAAGMNPSEKQSLIKLIHAIREQGVTVILIEHDMTVVMQISDEVLVLDHGIVIARGRPTEVSKDRRVIEAYLGVDQA